MEPNENGTLRNQITLYEDMKGGNMLFVHALAATLLEVDRQPDRTWTTDMLHTYLEVALRDLHIYQEFPDRYYDHARLLWALVVDAIALLRPPDE